MLYGCQQSINEKLSSGPVFCKMDLKSKSESDSVPHTDRLHTDTLMQRAYCIR